MGNSNFQNGYRAILFDLDGTIRQSPHSPGKVFVEICRELGLEFAPDAHTQLVRWQHIYWIDQEQIRSDMENGPEEFWLAFNRKQLRHLGMSGDLEPYVVELDRRFRELFAEQSGIVAEDVAPTLRTLREQGYCVGLVSNRNEPLAAEVEALELEGLFHFTLSAGEANSWKPDTGIFHKALDHARVAAQTAVYVGDNYYADVIGARNAGLTPLLIDPHDYFPEADCDKITRIGEVLDWLWAQ